MERLETITFLGEMKKGQLGEELFIDFLNRHNFNFEDLRYNIDFQELDIDFFVEDKYFEVKTDYKIRNTGNVVIELMNIRDGFKCSGWFHKTKADNLVIIDPIDRKGYRLRIKELREYLRNTVYTTKIMERIDCGKHTESIIGLIPLHKLIEADLVYEFQL